MRATRELPLAAAILLAGLALFFGGGPGDGAIPWLGGGVLVALLACLALQGVPRGALAVAPLVGVAVWCAVSIDWSWLPDRSWNYANRTLVYALFAALGLFVAGRTRGLANGLAAVLAAVLAWSLLGKVLPPVYDYGSPFVEARLQGPIGLWNQLALAADYALVLAVWRRGRSGTLLAYLALVALFLTYSRGGILTAIVVVGLWLLLGGAWLESAVTLVAAALPAGAAVGIAFALPGVTQAVQPLHVRWRDGLVFGVVLLAGAGASLALAHMPRPRDTAALRRAALAAAGAALAAGVAVLVVRGIGSDTVSNNGGRVFSTSSNFRFTWWHQAWQGFEHHVLLGTGAGSFGLVNALYRSTYLDQTTEPHDLPLQYLQETGVVGLVLLVVALAALLRPGWRRRGHELALALLLPAFVVHSLVDVDWDFLAVAAPAFLAAGALAGRPAAGRVSALGLLPAAGAAALAFAVLLLPWLGSRWADQAYFRSITTTKGVDALANKAHSVDPLLLEPYWAHAQAADLRGKRALAFAWYVQAVKRQPHNWRTWNYAGEYAFGLPCYGRAYDYLEKFTELNQKAQPSLGGADYNTALKKVNLGEYNC